MILDETWSYGILGRTGRGVTEHQNVDPTNVDMIVGGLAGALASGGGFCAGTEEIIEHQRLSAAAYTFSAALPALLATTASETVIEGVDRTVICESRICPSIQCETVETKALRTVELDLLFALGACYQRRCLSWDTEIENKCFPPLDAAMQQLRRTTFVLPFLHGIETD